MEKRPHALLLKFPGTNCDAETARALETAGFAATILPSALAAPKWLADADLVVLSGGFSYGDYVMAGRLAQLEAERKLGGALKEFYQGGGHLLGICNGFQILTQLGLLPEGSLIDNTSGRFQCRWVKLQRRTENNAFLQGLPEEFELPVAHAEGRFVAPGDAAKRYADEGFVALQYAEDVNGSQERIAGLQDSAGRILGLMPHPERFLYRAHHYDRDWFGHHQWGWGYFMFKSIADRISAGQKAAA